MKKTEFIAQIFLLDNPVRYFFSFGLYLLGILIQFCYLCLSCNKLVTNKTILDYGTTL